MKFGLSWLHLIQEKSDATPKEEKAGDAEEEEVDIDLNDPEVGAAALKIQAGFRGFQTRKEMKEIQVGWNDSS